ncbi:hypothetical protein MSAN_01604200 [Mycena sanguinolenta]|uniref:Uncharacterized protein n=1 Tax=Mycena sanguinolenta TaxID=230812 RepID=A0A8H6Y4B3_9AGAR|nr:hypothetical protein MSAN_01604200 [Mycena sanguinolenta]
MLSRVLLVLTAAAGTLAVNDWNTPCVNGQCSYDLPSTANGPSGTMKIWGSENAITDLTQAAHWQILDCDPNALSQNIRLVCTNDDPTSLCGHVYQNGGAIDKIARLPENCGANAFARISNSWVSANQSIPNSIQSRLVRRDGAQPTVQALAIDTDFGAADWTKNGPVNIAIEASNTPTTTAPGTGTTPAPRSYPFVDVRRSRRGFLSKIHSIATHVGGEATSVIGHVTSDIASVATGVATAIKSAASSAESVVAGATAVDGSKTFTPDPLTFNESKNLFNTSVDCGGPVSASLSVDVTGNVNLAPSITITANGTLIPTKFTNLEAATSMTAQLGGNLTISADITGQVDSGKITLLNVGIPGFDFPGVLSLGPFFTVDAEFTGEVDLAMDMAVGINFNVNNAQLTFPPSDASAADPNAFSVGDTPLQLTASPGIQATGTLTAHLIPTINLGVKALDGSADATIFLALDTSASLVLSLDAGATITGTAGDNSTSSASVSSAAASETSAASSTDSSLNATDTSAATSVDATDSSAATSSTSIDGTDSTSTSADATDSSAAAASTSADATDGSAAAASASLDPTTTVTGTALGSIITPVPDDGTTTDAAVKSRQPPSKRDNTTASASFGGCVQVNAGLAVNAGAEGDFFGLFKDTAQVSLFSKNFQIFQASPSYWILLHRLTMIPPTEMLRRRHELFPDAQETEDAPRFSESPRCILVPSGERSGPRANHRWYSLRI